MDSLLQDIKFAVRSVRRAPWVTAVGVLSLALGVGANTTIFSIINTLFLTSLPVEKPSDLMAVYTTDSQTSVSIFGGLSPMSHPNFRDLRADNQVFTDLAAYTFSNPLSLATGGVAEPAFGELVTGNYFDVLGVRPLAGRFFGRDDDVSPGAHPLAVLSYAAWQRRLGGDPSVLGKHLLINGAPYTVVGIAPEGFRGVNAIFSPDLWLPFMMYRQILPATFREWPLERRALMLSVAGRLKPGVTPAQADAHLKTLAAGLEREYPDPNRGRSIALRPLVEGTIFPGFRQVMVLGSAVLMTVVGLVLLIACSNVANILMARASARRPEMALRVALGATRARLIRQLLTESVIIAVGGGAVGLLVAVLGRDAILALRPPFLAQNVVVPAFDGRVLAFTVGVSLLTGLVFGLVPAVRASRAEPGTALHEESRSVGPSRRRIGIGNLLVVGQVALSIVALVAAALFLRSLQNANTIDPGFETTRLGLVVVSPGQGGYTDARAQDFFRQAKERAGRAAGVRSVAWSSSVPLFGGYFRMVVVEGREAEPGGGRSMAVGNTISPGYFSTMEIPLLRGRDFTDADRVGAPRVAIVNEQLARRAWRNQDPIGMRFRFAIDNGDHQVVGVAATTKYNTLGEEPQPAVFVPLAQNPSDTMTLLIGTTGDAGAPLGAVLSQLREIDPRVPLTNPLTMPALIDNALWFVRMAALLLGVMGLLALTLAAVGLYGLLAYSVTQRTREIGVRMALGADRIGVLGMVLAQSMRLVVAGVAIGFIGAFAISRVVARLLFGVSATDPIAFASVAIGLLSVAAVASYIPAARASRVDPMHVLRC